MPSAPPENFHGLLGTMKRATAALRDADVDFMLGGGFAIWACGGPPTDHDVDLYVRERDALVGLAALVQAGFRETDRPRTGCTRRGRATTSSTSSFDRPAVRSGTSTSSVPR